MPINRNAYDREEDELVRQVNAGEISQEEFDRAMRDMRDEIAHTPKRRLRGRTTKRWVIDDPRRPAGRLRIAQR